MEKCIGNWDGGFIRSVESSEGKILLEMRLSIFRRKKKSFHHRTKTVFHFQALLNYEKTYPAFIYIVMSQIILITQLYTEKELQLHRYWYFQLHSIWWRFRAYVVVTCFLYNVYLSSNVLSYSLKYLLPISCLEIQDKQRRLSTFSIVEFPENILMNYFWIDNDSEFTFDGFTKDVCRSMIAMLDSDHSGKLGLDEFKNLWRDIQTWKVYIKEITRIWAIFFYLIYILFRTRSKCTIEITAVLWVPWNFVLLCTQLATALITLFWTHWFCVMETELAL